MYRRNKVLTVVKSEFVIAVPIVALADYDDNHCCTHDSIETSTVLQRGFADSSLEATNSRQFSVVLEQSGDHSFAFSKSVLFFYAKSDGVVVKEKKWRFCIVLKQRHLWTRLGETYTAILSDGQQTM